MKMKILLLSAYDAQSHQVWHSQLTQHLTEIDWTVLTLPPRFFNWRIRGNSLSWAFKEQELLKKPYDLVLATSMTDLTSLRSFIPSLTRVPNYLYFHENQFAYPSKQQHHLLDPQIVTLYSALSADQIFFNSKYNQATFLNGVQKFLKSMPDFIPSQLIENLENKSFILPVPIADSFFTTLSNSGPQHQRSHKKTQLLWNHRWEYDKGPERLYELMKALEEKAFDYKIHIVGQQFRNSPIEFKKIKEDFKSHIDSWGYIEDKKDYRDLLHRCDFVISTAMHDFQGLSILEATASGCIPIVPDRLVYPEWFSAAFCYSSFTDDPKKEAESAADKIIELAHQNIDNPNINHLKWSNLSIQYLDFFSRANPTLKEPYETS